LSKRLQNRDEFYRHLKVTGKWRRPAWKPHINRNPDNGKNANDDITFAFQKQDNCRHAVLQWVSNYICKAQFYSELQYFECICLPVYVRPCVVIGKQYYSYTTIKDINSTRVGRLIQVLWGTVMPRLGVLDKSWSRSWDHGDSVFVTHEAWNWDKIENCTLNYNDIIRLFTKAFGRIGRLEWIISHSGLLVRANRARMGDNMLSQLVYLRCNNKL